MGASSGSEGTLVAFTIMYMPDDRPHDGKAPRPALRLRLGAAGRVRRAVLDHFINVEPDMDKVWVGMRCRVVLRPKEERIGDLSDIRYFDPLPGQVKPAGAGK